MHVGIKQRMDPLFTIKYKVIVICLKTDILALDVSLLNTRSYILNGM